AAVGLLDAFDVLVISGELGAAKPEPVIFRTACIALGVPAEQVVHVGDRLDLDALGARRAGLHGVWLDRSRNGGPTEVEDVPVIPDLVALPGVVAELDTGSRETCLQGRAIGRETCLQGRAIS
ncbi:MAG: HAD family hydrolase, partial [Actinomycetota bacterium]|nr:HAD family hydrolase [Actinomycetota bacterium]